MNMQKVKRKQEDLIETLEKKKKVKFANTKATSKDNSSCDKQGLTKKGKTCTKDKQKKKQMSKYSVDKTGKSNFTKGKNDKFGPKGKTGFSKDKPQTPAPGEKPKWSEMKKEKKQLRIVRRKAKASPQVFEVAHKAKLLSAQIQRKVVKPEFRTNSCKELHGLLKGQYKSIALTHDLSRVIQVLLKYGSEDIKTEVTEELLDVMVQMVQSKYGQHAVKRIIKYGTDFIRHEVIKRFFGHIVTLAAHSISAPVLDYAYGEFATKKEKLFMQQEFYGEIYKNSKDDKLLTLGDAYKGSPEMKTAILQSCKANIQRILDKNLHDGELLHSVLYEYMRECSAEDKVELITSLSPLIVPLTNSLPGVNAASVCVWQGTNKDKKTIMKVVKEHAVALSKHKTGYRLLLAIFDSVDDTVLVKKAIVSSLAGHLKDVAKDHWGKMTLHWLVKPKDKGAFHPSLIKFLEEGYKSSTSKKDSKLRVTELRESIVPALRKEIEKDAEFWLSDKTNFLLAVAVLSVEHSKETLDALARVICSADWKIKRDEQEVLAVEDAGIHMCLKKLAALDKDSAASGYTLGEAVCGCLASDTLKQWIPTNRGCFFLLKLIESNQATVANKLRQKISSQSALLSKQTAEGASLLLRNINK